MEFNDTPEEAAFRTEARSWLEANTELLDPGEINAGGISERTGPKTVKAAQAWQKKKAEAGWACITWPKEYGGRAATPMQNVIWSEEQAKFRTPPEIFGIGTGMCGPTLLAHGSDEQKERWIPKLISGEEIWCQGFSEPEAGSDLTSLTTRAERKGDFYIVNGNKIWTSMAHWSQWMILVARPGEEGSRGRGLSLFVLPTDSPGIEVRPIDDAAVGVSNRGRSPKPV